VAAPLRSGGVVAAPLRSGGVVAAPLRASQRAQVKSRGVAVNSHLAPSRRRRSSRSSSSASRRPAQAHSSCTPSCTPIVHPLRAPLRAPPSCTPIVHPFVHDAASLTPLCTAYPQLEAAELTSEETAVPLPLCARMCGGAAAVEQRATVRSSVHRPAHGVMRSTGHAFPPHARPAAAAAAAAEQ
jgi:hypothetical protein